MCPHQPPCPPADRPDRDAARTIAFHPEQGWSLLCNGVILFDDTGELLPGGLSVPPHDPPASGGRLPPESVTWVPPDAQARMVQPEMAGGLSHRAVPPLPGPAARHQACHR